MATAHLALFCPPPLIIAVALAGETTILLLQRRSAARGGRFLPVYGETTFFIATDVSSQPAVTIPAKAMIQRLVAAPLSDCAASKCFCKVGNASLA
jgi:hypothetical protein